MQQDQQIIDAIEQKSFTYAKSLIRLKQLKNPNQSYYWALSNYLLYKQGDTEHSLQECNKLLEKFPNDPRTTDLLYKIYWEQGKEKESNQVYEKIIKRFPNNCEPLLTQWFHNSLKFQNLKSLQKSATQLLKLNPLVKKYKFWSALANYLFANSLTNDPKQYNLFLQLGYKAILDIIPDTTQELYIFIKLLSAIDKSRAIAAIEIFTNTHNQPLDLDCKILYLQLLHEQENFENLKQVTDYYLFTVKFNDFNTWKLYIIANAKLLVPFDQLEAKILEYPWSRNSQLALIELCKIYNNQKFVDYCLQYYDKFCSKLCCFHDLKYYLPSEDLKDSDIDIKMVSLCREELLKRIGNITDELLSNDESSNINDRTLATLVVNQKLVHYFGKSFADNQYFINNYKIYTKFLPLVSEKLETDFYLANQLILINILCSLDQDFSTKNIFKLILELKYLVSKDPLDFEVNSWLMRLLYLLNINDEVFQIYDKLKIRMFQNDSLGYFIINNVSLLNPSKNNLQFLINIYRFYLSYESDAIADIERAFNEQIYNKLESFLSFNHKLLNSIQYNQLIMELYKITRLSNDKGYQQFFQTKLTEAADQIFNPNRGGGGNGVIQYTFADNRDYKILWKNLGFSPMFTERFMKRFPETSDYLLKLDMNKELLIMNFHEGHFKTFNKLTSLPNPSPQYPEQASKFNSWLFKIYGSLFKLHHKLNKSEFDSCNNYLMKNLKFTKIPLTKGVLSWELNYELIQLLQLASFVAKRENLYKNYIPLVNNLTNEINTSFKENQLEELDNFKTDIGCHKFQFDITQDFINDCVDRFRGSLVRSSYVNFK